MPGKPLGAAFQFRGYHLDLAAKKPQRSNSPGGNGSPANEYHPFPGQIDKHRETGGLLGDGLPLLPLAEPLQLLLGNGVHGFQLLRRARTLGAQGIRIVVGHKLRAFRRNIPGHRQIHQHPGLPGDCRQGVIGYGMVGAGGGGHHRVQPLHGLHSVFIVHGAAAWGNRRFPMAIGSQRHPDGGSALPQQPGCQLPHLAVSDHENPFAFQAAQFPRQNIPAPASHGRIPPGYGYFRPGPLARGHRIPEQGRQRSVGGFGLQCQLHGFSHLGDDLILPQNLGVKTAGHLHQMSGGIHPAPGSKIRLHIRLRDTGSPAQKPPGRFRLPVQIQFRSVAGGQQHAARNPTLGAQPAQRLHRPFGRKGQPLPLIQRRGVAVQAGHHQHSSVSPFTITREK